MSRPPGADADSDDRDQDRLLREALAACESEPIHIPGSIQPDGVLIGLREPDLVVTAVSANAGDPVDLSGARLRGVSPVHLRYLANMGVAASMSLSLVVDGELWGLVSCHHYGGSRPLPYRVRAAAELVARTASILLESVTRAELARARAEAAERRSNLTAALAAGTGEPGAILVHHGDELLGLVGADGAVVRLGDSVLTYGRTLDGPSATAVAERLLEPSAAPVTCDCLGEVDPTWSRWLDVAAGALVAPVGKDGRSWLLWTAGELRRTVTWGGDPESKELRITDEGPRLNPRRSFEAWTEEVSGRSRPWTRVEVEEAGNLARTVADLLLRRSMARDQVAGALARTLLLERIPELPGLRTAVRYLPAADGAFGGDWYDVLYRPDGHVAIALGDVAGHGMEAASITAQLRQGLRAYLLGERSPAAALTRLNDLCTWVLPDDLATALVVDVDPATGGLTWASAGHLPPLATGPPPGLVDGERGPALGVVDGAAYRDNRGRLDPDGLIVLYSDGLVERRGLSIDEQLDALVRAVPDGRMPAEALCEAVIQALGASAGVDDVTVLAFGRAET